MRADSSGERLVDDLVVVGGSDELESTHLSNLVLVQAGEEHYDLGPHWTAHTLEIPLPVGPEKDAVGGRSCRRPAGNPSRKHRFRPGVQTEGGSVHLLSDINHNGRHGGILDPSVYFSTAKLDLDPRAGRLRQGPHPDAREGGEPGGERDASRQAPTR